MCIVCIHTYEILYIYFTLFSIQVQIYIWSFVSLVQLYCYIHVFAHHCTCTHRAGNSLIGFPSESLVFCPIMSEWAICSKKLVIHSFAHFWWATWAICSRSLISSERPERIAHGRSFLVSDLSDWLTSLIFGEQHERFAHNAQRKWAIVSESLTLLTKKEEKWEKNEQFAHLKKIMLNHIYK